MRDATEKKLMILEYIRKELETKGYPPSVREICAAVGLKSTSTVHAHLNRLEEEGYIRRDATKPRAMELTEGTQAKGRSVPLVGRVTAGVPILAQQNIDDYFMLPKSIIGGEDAFILTVQGESMIEAGILNGDYVVVRRQSDAENGDIVVAMIDDEATVKRIYYEDGRVRLQPENSSMSPIYADNVSVLGKVIALFRQM
ncbi:MAG: transcriptional repressor LexA [Clostridia bacterium]|nr:transcriptional repressor LexA [Clostridia bacterium]MBQ4157551.1 transcriptional repressor LexA [Clostridia bacterium]